MKSQKSIPFQYRRTLTFCRDILRLKGSILENTISLTVVILIFILNRLLYNFDHLKLEGNYVELF